MIISQDLIDWNSIIDHLESRKGVRISNDPSIWDLSNPKYLDIKTRWDDPKFNANSIEWINYYPEIDFSKTITNQISDFLSVKPHRSWISRINPGYFAPWHWDVDDHEDQYLKYGEILRYNIFISNPTPGQIFILENNYYFDQEQGTILKWKNHRQWHCGINASFVPKYMFNLVCYE